MTNPELAERVWKAKPDCRPVKGIAHMVVMDTTGGKYFRWVYPCPTGSNDVYEPNATVFIYAACIHELLHSGYKLEILQDPSMFHVRCGLSEENVSAPTLVEALLLAVEAQSTSP